ncbi:hypothetical protein TNIN_78361, partial [Trichonephila inaurata madagascariensis]
VHQYFASALLEHQLSGIKLWACKSGLGIQEIKGILYCFIFIKDEVLLLGKFLPWALLNGDIELLNHIIYAQPELLGEKPVLIQSFAEC